MLVVGHCAGERRGDSLPDARFAPSSEALINRHPLAVFFRHVPPRRASADAPQNPVHDLPVVMRRTTLAASLRRQKVPQQTPFRFAQIATTQIRLPQEASLNQVSIQASISL